MSDRITLNVQGITPLLLHNPAGSMRVAGAGSTKGRTIPLPEEEAEAATYRTADGGLALPSIAFRNCIITAAGAYKRGRYNLRTFVSHIMTEPELVPITGPDGDVLESYEIDIRRAVVNRQGIMRCRPRLDPWRASFDVLYDDELLAGEDAEELFAKLLNDGGSRIGVGDYRPERKGWFGRFTVA